MVLPLLALLVLLDGLKWVILLLTMCVLVCLQSTSLLSWMVV